MKKFFVINAIGVFLFFYFWSSVYAEECVTIDARGKIIFNEISSFSSSDWVEIYNLFDKCIDLSSFSIWDSTDKIKTFSTGTKITSQEYLQVSLSNRLNKSGDSVIFKYEEEEWDRFDYGSGSNYSAAEDGSFWVRIPDGGEWVLSNTSTPGASNNLAVIPPVDPPTIDPTPTTTPPPDIPTSTPTSTDDFIEVDFSKLTLNEIFPDPESGNEWVEIYNADEKTIVINGLKVCDNRLTVCKNVVGEIASGGLVLVDLGTGFLNNSGDSAILKGLDDNILDQIDFGVVGKGRSLARFPDGVGGWSVTIHPTPNNKNIITPPPSVSSGNSGANTISETSVKSSVSTKINLNANTSSFFGKIILNEILPDPEGSDTEEEYVEIKNISSENIDLGGWAISDMDKKYFISGKIISGEILFWKRQNTGISLNNSTAEEIFLWDQNGSIVDRIKYDKALGSKSLSRFENIWKWTEELTPGKENVLEEIDTTGIVWKLKYPVSGVPGEMLAFSAEDSVDPRGGSLSFVWDFGNEVILSGERVEQSFSTSGIFSINISASSSAGTIGKKEIKIKIGGGLSLQSGNILISEIMYDPEGSDDKEYIELWNNSSNTIDISGWQLRAGSKAFQIPDKTFITDDGVLVFYRAATKISLINSGGKVELFTPGETVVDIVKYGKSVSGKSYSLIGGQWIMSIPSPGFVSENVLPENKTNNSSSGKGIWYKKYSISEVRDQEKGANVLVSGVVVVLPNVFGTQYFYLFDGESGIAIYQHKKDFPVLRVGDLVEVRGVVSEANGQKRINIKQASAVDILAVDKIIEPQEVVLSDVEETPVGSLVKFIGDLTEKKSGYWYVDDGLGEVVVYFKNGTGIDTSVFNEGQKVEIIGILEQGKNGLQVWPREEGDIKVVGTAKELVQKEPEGDWKTYFSAAAGGATALFLGFVARVRGLAVLTWVGRGVRTLTSIIRRG